MIESLIDDESSPSLRGGVLRLRSFVLLSA